jgi:hypothetical protein
MTQQPHTDSREKGERSLSPPPIVRPEVRKGMVLARSDLATAIALVERLSRRGADA